MFTFPIGFNGSSGGNINTVALLHMDGLNGGTSFTDEAGTAWTATGATTDTSIKKFGTASLNSTVASQYITSSSNLIIPSGDFTFEFWLYNKVSFNSLTSNGAGFAHSPGNNDFECYQQGGGRIFLYLAHITTGAWAYMDPAINTWSHIAFVLSGSVVKVYLNGVGLLTHTDAGFPVATNGVIQLGLQSLNYLEPAQGYMDEVRISSVARYTSNFTPQTSPFILD